jgi:hypothetical protein
MDFIAALINIIKIANERHRATNFRYSAGAEGKRQGEGQTKASRGGKIAEN